MKANVNGWYNMETKKTETSEIMDSAGFDFLFSFIVDAVMYVLVKHE